MALPNDDQPPPENALRVACGVQIPVQHFATISAMYRAAEDARAAIRTLRLYETEPATIFLPLRPEGDAGDA